MEDLDISRIVELATAMEIAEQRNQRALEITRAMRSLDKKLGQGDPKQEAIDIAVKAGVQKKYAERAVSRLFPDLKDVSKKEKEFEVEKSQQRKIYQAVEIYKRFLIDLNEILSKEFPDLDVISIYDTIFNFVDEKRVELLEIVTNPKCSLKISNLFGDYNFVSSFRITKLLGKERYFRKRKAILYFTVRFDTRDFNSPERLIGVDIYRPEMLNIIAPLIRKHFEKNAKIISHY